MVARMNYLYLLVSHHVRKIKIAWDNASLYKVWSILPTVPLLSWKSVLIISCSPWSTHPATLKSWCIGWYGHFITLYVNNIFSWLILFIQQFDSKQFEGNNGTLRSVGICDINLMSLFSTYQLLNVEMNMYMWMLQIVPYIQFTA